MSIILKKLALIEARLEERKEVLTLDEAARFLNMTKSYLYKLTSAGILPHSKPNGKLLYFSREELTKWALTTGKRAGSEGIDIIADTYLAKKKGGK
jgi:excisionase family DNA binding protein